MDNLTYIPINELYAHPDNPRKDLGDLSELADSIKENGVLQNLTVIKGHYLTSEECFALGAQYQESSSKEILEQMNTRSSSAGYTVVIGHRRLAAAKLAGLTELPCVVTEMTAADQVRTMLMENMQRSDLTVYEQAQGFQMMLDLGDTVETLAEKSGFSKSTVRRRVKLLELDEAKFKASVNRGATLQDYMELDKIEDPELKNEVLDAIGTDNFRNKLQTAISKEKDMKYIAEVIAVLDTFAERDDSIVHGEKQHVRNYSPWNKKNGVQKPEDADTVRYYYRVWRSEVDLYKDRAEPTEEDTAEKERKEREADALKRRAVELEVAEGRAYKLRFDFVRNYSAAKKHIKEIMKGVGQLLIRKSGKYFGMEYDALAELLGLSFDEENEEFPTDEYMACFETRPEYALLALVFAGLDSEDSGYSQRQWNSEKQAYVRSHERNDGLDYIYDLLVSLGYTMSDEEKQLQYGTHELFSEVTAEE